MTASAYGATVLEHFRRPRNRGALPWPALSSEGTNALCGDRVRVQARVEDGRVAELRFAGDACAIAVAAASLLTGAARGLSLDECAALEEAPLLASLGAPIPPERRRCATLALEALRAGARALRDGYTTALLLAAGRSSRFGGRKLVAELGGVPVVRHAAERILAARPAELLVVVGHDGADVRAALAGLPLRFVLAPDDGAMSDSLRAGIAAIGGASRRVLVALGDQPRVESAVVAAVLAASAAPIVVPRYRGVRGHPVRFDRALLPELAEVRGDRGARDVLGRDPARVLELEIDAAPPADVDTAADLASLAS